jgi:hypothetical protein
MSSFSLVTSSLLYSLLSISLLAQGPIKYNKKVKTLKKETKTAQEIKDSLAKMIEDSFYDPNMDYSRFMARVTDRDPSATIFKIHATNRNIKFFRSGDKIRFKPSSAQTDYCIGNVRTREQGYVTIYVKDISKCWTQGRYFRRGTLINVYSGVLANRVRDASIHRVVLLKRRTDFLHQLNDINHFSWSYDQQRLQLASEYDQKILELKNDKRRALDALMKRKSESNNLQQTLGYRLDHLDKDLEFYRVDPDISDGDRWQDDHDLGKPVSNRPQSIITINDFKE